MQRRGRASFIFTFLAPAVVIYGLLVVIPLLQAFQFSTYSWSGLSSSVKFVGLENYRRLIADPHYFGALKNNLWLMLFAGVPIVATSVAIAHGLKGADGMTRFLRSVFLIPHILSMVIVAILWQFLLNPSFGLVDKALRALHMPTPASGWLGDSSWAIWGLWLAFIWYGLGFYVMLFAAGVRGIPAEIEEAAVLDGANGWQKFWQVTWPMLWSIKRVVVVYVVINCMNIFALVQLMTEGGPDRATDMLVRNMYEQAFLNSKMGYATAMGVANLAVALGLAAIVMAFFRRNPEASR